jgi:diacylglycerol kinase
MGVSSKSRLIDLSVEEMHEIIQSAKEVESSGSYFRALVTALFFAGPVVLT